jgi:lipoprotein signal peptidase
MKTNLIVVLGALAVDRLARAIAMYGELAPTRFVGGAVNAYYVFSLHVGFLYNVEAPIPLIVAVMLGYGMLLVCALRISEVQLVARHRLARLAIGLMVAAVVSQAADFILYGGGIDYLLIFNSHHDGIVANLADVMAMFSIAILLISTLKELNHGKQHPARSGYDGSRSIRDLRNQPDHG